MTDLTKLLIVDDDSATRCMLRMSLEKECDIVGEAEDGIKAIKANDELQPQVVLLDISMPKMDGFSAAKYLKEARPDVRIIFVSTFRQAVYVDEAFRVGGDGYVLKESAVLELTTAIREVLAGRQFCSESISAGL